MAPPPLRRPAGTCLFCLCFALFLCVGDAWQQQPQPYPRQDQGYWTSPYPPPRPQSWPYYQNGGAWGPTSYGSPLTRPPAHSWSQLPVLPTFQQVTANQPPIPPPQYQPVPANQQPVLPTNQQVAVYQPPVSPTHQQMTTNQFPEMPPHQVPNSPHEVLPAFNQMDHPPAPPEVNLNQQSAMTSHQNMEPVQHPAREVPVYQQMTPYERQVTPTREWDPSYEQDYGWSNAAASSPGWEGWEQPPPPRHAHEQHVTPVTSHHGWGQPMLWDPSWSPSWEHPEHHEDVSPMRPTRSSAPPSWVQNPNLARPIGCVILAGRTRVPVRDYRLVLEHYLRGAWRDALSISGARIASSDFGEFERSVRTHQVLQVRVSAHATVPAVTYCQVVRSAQNPGHANAVLELPDGKTCPLHQLAGRADMAAWMHALFPQGLVPGRHHGTPHVWAPVSTTPSPPTPPTPRVREANVTSSTVRPEDSRTPTEDYSSLSADSSTPRPTAAAARKTSPAPHAAPSTAATTAPRTTPHATHRTATTQHHAGGTGGTWAPRRPAVWAPPHYTGTGTVPKQGTNHGGSD